MMRAAIRARIGNESIAAAPALRCGQPSPAFLGQSALGQQAPLVFITDPQVAVFDAVSKR